MSSYGKLIWNFLTSNIPLKEPNGGMPVNIQDQTSPAIILPLVRKIGTTTTTAATVIGLYTFQVASVSGMVIGQHVRIINPSADKFYSGTILTINGLIITVDNPINYVLASGSEVTFSTTNMNVDGSVTPVSFRLRTGIPSIPSVIDVTRIIISCTTTSAVSLNKFGNLNPLTRGILFRRHNDEIFNIFNIKTNGELAGIAYDVTPWVASNPAQGTDGFSSRLTFADQEKMGVVLRIGSEGNLEMLVQDNLTSLTSFKVMVEGHVVVDA